MGWSDEPTEVQIGTIFSWIRWVVDRDTAQRAVNWLQNNATRRDVSYEMTRLKALKQKRLLDVDKLFQGEVWEGFGHD